MHQGGGGVLGVKPSPIPMLHTLGAPSPFAEIGKNPSLGAASVHGPAMDNPFLEEFLKNYWKKAVENLLERIPDSCKIFCKNPLENFKGVLEELPKQSLKKPSGTAGYLVSN